MKQRLKGRRKLARNKASDDLDLTPFIGLFAMLVILLIVTAAWNQLESFKTKTDNVTAADNPPPKDDKKKEIKLSVLMQPKMVEMKIDVDGQPYPFVVRDFDRDEIKQRLAMWKQRYPKKKDVVLISDNSIDYGKMIEMMDLLVAGGFPDVGVSTQ